MRIVASRIEQQSRLPRRPSRPRSQHAHENLELFTFETVKSSQLETKAAASCTTRTLPYTPVSAIGYSSLTSMLNTGMGTHAKVDDTHGSGAVLRQRRGPADLPVDGCTRESAVQPAAAGQYPLPAAGYPRPRPDRRLAARTGCASTGCPRPDRGTGTTTSAGTGPGRTAAYLLPAAADGPEDPAGQPQAQTHQCRR